MPWLCLALAGAPAWADEGAASAPSSAPSAAPASAPAVPAASVAPAASSASAVAQASQAAPPSAPAPAAETASAPVVETPSPLPPAATPAPASPPGPDTTSPAASAPSGANAVTSYALRPEVQAWAQAAAQKHQLDAQAMLATLSGAVYQPSVVRAIMPPPAGTAKNWTAYRARFTDGVRVRSGVEFMKQNAGWLTKAEAEHGVPSDVILGIIGVETIYGRNKGNYRVLDALATLAFDFPTGRKDRSAFFKEELAELFKLAQRQGQSVDSYRGSYAGAMGWPQFMPSSWNKYAVDGDGDGRDDLINNPADAIASVAHYLSRFGWVRGLPTHFSINPPVDTSARAALLQPDILPSFSVERMTALGAQLPEVVRHYPGDLALIELQNGTAAPSYVAGTKNFYAITRYNWSSYYAMAVIELGQIVHAVGRKLR